MNKIKLLLFTLLSVFFTNQLSAQVYDIEDFIGTWNGTISSELNGGYNYSTTIIFNQNDNYTESTGTLMPTIYPNTQWWTYEPETNRIGFHWLQTVYSGQYFYTHVYHEIVSFNGYELVLHYNFWDDPEPWPEAQTIIVTKEGGTPPPVCAQPWPVEETSLMHTISIPGNAELSVNGTSLTADDWMGVFYTDDEGNKVCAGTCRVDENGNGLVMAYGDNPSTPEKDGFADGEAFVWKVFLCSSETQIDAAANYDQSQPDKIYFNAGGNSSLTALGGMACQEYMFIEGWNSFSSYVSPEIANLDDLFMAQMNEMIVLRNLSAMYWPAQGVNTLGNLDNNSGYVMKVSADNTLDFCGIHSNTNAIELSEGWNYLPVPGACNVSAMELFSGNMDNIALVQELIGTKVFWPETGIYSLETLEPGKAYAIQVENPFTLTFPDCVGDGQNSSQSQQINSIETPWGEIMMTPSTQVIALLETATAGLQSGDAIGVFGENDEIYGYAEIGEGGIAQTITLFGDDETTSMQDGFMDNEYLTYKIYRPETEESFPMNVEYDYNFGNTSGMFEAGTYSAIINIVLTITGIDDAEGVNFGMYPNPATDVLNISSTGFGNSNYSVEIIDATGNTVSKNSFFGNGSIDLSSIPSGFYFVKISNDTFNQTRKLIIK